MANHRPKARITFQSCEVVVGIVASKQMREFEVRYASKANGPSGHPEKIVSEIAGATWRMKRDAAVGWIEVDAHTFYIKQGDQLIYLVIAAHNGQSWLRTSKDWAQPNLLLNLPDCPAELHG